MNIDIRQDDLSSAEVQSLIAEHLSGMHSNSPPGHVHALAIENLRAPSVTFWTAWVDGILCGCGALKELDPHTGEVKSMRTRSAFLRRGVGQAVLDEIFVRPIGADTHVFFSRPARARPSSPPMHSIDAMVSSGAGPSASMPPRTSMCSWRRFLLEVRCGLTKALQRMAASLPSVGRTATAEAQVVGRTAMAGIMTSLGSRLKGGMLH